MMIIDVLIKIKIMMIMVIMKSYLTPFLWSYRVSFSPAAT